MQTLSCVADNDNNTDFISIFNISLYAICKIAQANNVEYVTLIHYFIPFEISEGKIERF